MLLRGCESPSRWDLPHVGREVLKAASLVDGLVQASEVDGDVEGNASGLELVAKRPRRPSFFSSCR